MTREEILEARQALLDEADEILTRSDDGLADEDATRFEEIESEVKKLDKRLSLFDVSERMREHGDDRGPRAPQYKRDADPFEDPGHETPVQVRGRAMKAVERWNAEDDVKEGATRLLERAGSGWADPTAADHDAAGVAGHVIRFSQPDYLAAFAAYTRDPEGGFLAELSPDQARAWRENREYARATLQTSGAVLPSPLDPTVNLTNTGVAGSLREVARVDSTIAKEKRYVTSAGATFSWDAELAEVSDDTPTLGEKTITTEKLQGWIETSIEVALDQPGFGQFGEEVGRIMADARMRAEASVLIDGTSGSNQPIGVETRLVGSASEVDPASAETFAAADVYSTIEDLPPRWRPGARWVAELSTINQIDQFETGNGAKLFPEVGNADSVLLRRRLHENSNVSAFSDINAGATADHPILYVGDWSMYVILDRIGSSVHFIPPGVLVNSSNQRPDGRVGWYLYSRVGADTLDIDAFRVLNVATTA